jgi:hypothetical protein
MLVEAGPTNHPDDVLRGMEWICISNVFCGPFKTRPNLAEHREHLGMCLACFTRSDPQFFIGRHPVSVPFGDFDGMTAPLVH